MEGKRRLLLLPHLVDLIKPCAVPWALHGTFVVVWKAAGLDRKEKNGRGYLLVESLFKETAEAEQICFVSILICHYLIALAAV